MHFLRLLCPPFSFHQHTQSIISSHLLTQISAFIFTPAFTHVKFLQGFVKPRPPPPQKKREGMKLSKEKISYRRWTGSTSKTPLAVPSLQAQHPSPTSGKVVHFQGGVGFPPPPKPSITVYSLWRCPTLPPTEGKRTFFLRSHLQCATLCKGLILLQELPFSFYLHI